MSLLCSLLGHDYGESIVENEREQAGGEVIFSVREYEECVRCGTRHVISENTRRATVSADESEGDDGASESEDAAAPTGEQAQEEPAIDPPETATAEHDEGNVEKRSTAPQESPASEPSGPETAVPGDDGSADEVPETDNGEILEGGPAVTDEGDSDDSTPTERPVETETAEGGGGEILEGGQADESGHEDSTDESTPEEGSADTTTDESGGGEILEGGQAGESGQRDTSTEAGSHDQPREQPPVGGSEPRERDDADGPDEEPSGPAEGEDAEILTGDDQEPWPEEDESPGEPTGSAEPDSGIPDDDAEILEGPEHRPWPEGSEQAGQEGDPEGEAATEIVDGDEDTANGAGEPRPWPDADDSEDDAVVMGEDSVDSGIAAADSVPQDIENRRRDRGETYYCPNCAHREQVGDSSLRAGDICPECKEGYIAVRE